MLQELLGRSLELDVVTAEDGQEALSIARRSPPFDLALTNMPINVPINALMDAQMPGIDGFETTRRMRRITGYANVPLYALTANVHADDINTCLASGTKGHMGKPLILDNALPLFNQLWSEGQWRSAEGRPRCGPPPLKFARQRPKAMKNPAASAVSRAAPCPDRICRCPSPDSCACPAPRVPPCPP